VLAASLCAFDADAQFLDFCLRNAPDQTLYVMSSFSPQSFISNEDQYLCKQSLCPMFVVDVKLASYSNQCDYPVQTSCGVEVSTLGYDVPGSYYSGLGANHPDTQYDCDSFESRGRYYLMPSGSSSFTLQDSWTIAGAWSGTTCYVVGQPAPAFIVNYGSGWDTYRFMSWTLVRHSTQQTRIYVDTAPPP